jgi:death-on-curing protein
LIAEAAALWESLSQNHPFIDGNKRLSITLTAAFLSVNGVELAFDDHQAYAFVIDLYNTHAFKRDALEAWLRTHTKRP